MIMNNDLLASLALLEQGYLQKGLQQIQHYLSQKISPPGLAKKIGVILFQHRQWEIAYSWFLQAVQENPDDAEVSGYLARLYARDYLQPEYFDPLAGQTLKRYSPREADTYVYTIDVVGTCNLRCPTCPVGNTEDDLRAKNLMDESLFDKILQKIILESPAEKPQIWLYSWSEPLLHPQLPSFIKKIKAAGFSAHLSSNLNIEKGLKEVIKANPDELKISLSGFTPETYNKTHHKGNLLLVKSNLYKLRQYLDQYQSQTHVWVGHHLYKNNYHQQEEVKAICRELNLTYNSVQAFYQPLEKLIKLCEGDIPTSQEPILGELIVPPQTQIAFSKKHQQPHYDCELRFNQTVINTDGSLSQCCCQYETRNMPGIDFLDHTHDQIEEKKYQNPICQTCRKYGLDYAPRSLPESLIVQSS
jgi:pyruvate-formate lyase-activating enzyme